MSDLPPRVRAEVRQILDGEARRLLVEEIYAQPEQYVTRQELAEMMRVSVPTIDRMRREGMPSINWGRRLVRFIPSEAIGWAQERGRT